MFWDVSDARVYLETKAKFGDEKSIAARDVLRKYEKIKDLEEITCWECEGSGVRLVHDVDGFWDDEDNCRKCEGMGTLYVSDLVHDEVEIHVLDDVYDQAVDDGLIGVEDE